MRNEDGRIHFDGEEAWAMSVDPTISVDEIPATLTEVETTAAKFKSGARFILDDAAHPELHEYGHELNAMAASALAASQKLRTQYWSE